MLPFFLYQTSLLHFLKYSKESLDPENRTSLFFSVVFLLFTIVTNYSNFYFYIYSYIDKNYFIVVSSIPIHYWFSFYILIFVASV